MTWENGDSSFNDDKLVLKAVDLFTDGNKHRSPLRYLLIPQLCGWGWIGQKCQKRILECLVISHIYMRGYNNTYMCICTPWTNVLGHLSTNRFGKGPFLFQHDNDPTLKVQKVIIDSVCGRNWLVCIKPSSEPSWTHLSQTLITCTQGYSHFGTEKGSLKLLQQNWKQNSWIWSLIFVLTGIVKHVYYKKSVSILLFNLFLCHLYRDLC